MRLFTGISVDESVIPGLAAERSKQRLKWAPAANLHVTTKFIGEWPETGLPELQRALGEIPWPANIPIVVSGLELLPKVFVASVEPHPALIALARATEDTLERLGCLRESRPYRPHITLARIRNADHGAVRETISSMNIRSCEFEADSFHLYLSRASTYTKLATYP